MTLDTQHKPRPVDRVMISSTFKDLKDHRLALIKAIREHEFHPEVMEDDNARLIDVIDSSLKMVRDSAACILVIGLKYGQIPDDPDRNPDKVSITELEFNEAQRLNRPVLLFVMGDDHPVKKSDIETDPKKEEKLNAFRKRAKLASPGGKVNRVYSVFNSLEEFKENLPSSLLELCRHLDSIETQTQIPPVPPQNPTSNPIPKPPAFYAEPDYLGSHTFIGRESQLEELSDWAKPADPTNLLLFEAIGGNGKSMLTWEWVTNPMHALAARPADSPWAGRFWYSFYERGALMADFCRRALAYMTGRPLEEFAKQKTAAMAPVLLKHLHARPWLLILDGLERVLVHYHSIDADQLPDEAANAPTDKIVNRDPCDAIRDEDNDLIRQLAAVKPSKILVSSRLTPRVLLNQAGQAIPGARRITLPGLRPADAEALLRSCGVSGDSAKIQAYLTENCDNHPLVIGALGGLISNYLADRGNFDQWVNDADGGAGLNLASLDLIQRRNHILLAALDALPSASRQLLSTLALLSDSVDYETLKAFNPHWPPEPEEVEKPEPPEEYWRWGRLTDEEKAQRQDQYQADIKHWNDYEQAMEAWCASAEDRAAPRKFVETVRDLERRGLLQWDGRDKKYNLHPVVRGVAAGGMKADDKERYGLRVVDYFSSLPHSPYDEAETLEDLRPGLNVVRTLLKLGHFQRAAIAILGSLSNSLLCNLESYPEYLSLLRHFFPTGWGILPRSLDANSASYLANNAAGCLIACDEQKEALLASAASLQSYVNQERWSAVPVMLRNMSYCLREVNRLAGAIRLNALSLELAALTEDEENLFRSRLDHFDFQASIGQWAAAKATWDLVDPMGRGWGRNAYRPGDAEYFYAKPQFQQGTMEESHLVNAERLATEGKNRVTIRSLHRLRGAWRLQQGDWELAAASFAEAVRMARERGIPDADSETGLAFARYQLGQLVDPRVEAERLALFRKPSHRYLAMLWQAVGDHDQAKHHALAAYEWAWADGEPYVRRYELTKTTELLQQWNVPVPKLSTYDPSKDQPFPWEADGRAAMEKLRAKTQAKSES